VSKYGIENFNVIILDFCDVNALNEKEIYYISQFQSNNKKYGYNLSSGGNSGMVGYKHSEETRRKVSESKKGWKMSDAQREFISKLHTGKVVSEETRKKISKANSGINHYFFGKKHTEESIKKMTEKRTGESAYQFGKKSNNSSSKYFGVHKSVSKGHTYWIADIKRFGKHVYIGASKDEMKAAIMYDEFVIENNLPNPLNFSYE